MRAAVAPLASRFGWQIHEIDIDADAALEKRWSDRVPVLLAGDRELCHYWIDETSVTAFLSAGAHAKSR